MAKRLELEQTAFLYGGNGAFIEDLYARYLRDPSAIDPSWRGYFDELGPETRAPVRAQPQRAAAARRRRSPAAKPAAATAARSSISAASARAA